MERVKGTGRDEVGADVQLEFEGEEGEWEGLWFGLAFEDVSHLERCGFGLGLVKAVQGS